MAETAITGCPALIQYQQLQKIALFGLNTVSRDTAVEIADLRQLARFADSNVLRAVQKKGLLGRRHTQGGLVGVRAHAMWHSTAGVAAAEALPRRSSKSRLGGAEGGGK